MSKKVLILLLLSVIISTTCLTIYCIFFTFPTGHIQLSESVYNNYNNYITGGNLCRIGDNIYFNYRKSSINYGLAEIGLNGSKRIFWSGIQLKPYFSLGCLNSYGNNIVSEQNDYEYYCYQNGKKTTISQLFSENKYLLSNNLRTTPYGVLCVGLTENKIDNSIELGKTNVILYNNGKSQILFKDSEINDSYLNDAKYFAEDAVYYIGKNSKLHKLNLKTMQDEALMKLPKNRVSFIVENERLILKTEEHIYVYELSDPNKQPDVIVKGDYDTVYNVYNDKLYYCKRMNQDGVWEYDLNNKETKKLCNEQYSEIYIVDNESLLFTDNNSTLWKMSNQGGKAERVFG